MNPIRCIGAYTTFLGNDCRPYVTINRGEGRIQRYDLTMARWDRLSRVLYRTVVFGTGRCFPDRTGFIWRPMEE